MMWVGGKFYSRESFITEAKKMGVSKKIPFVPKDITIGESKVYLISDMSEAERVAYFKEVKRRDTVARETAKATGEKQTRSGFGSYDRGNPIVFGYFIVKSIIYVVKKGMSVPEELAKRGVESYTYEEGGFGSLDERGCGSLAIGGTYLLSEEDMEKVKDMVESGNVESGNIVVFDEPIPFDGKRFRGLREYKVE